MNTRKKQPQSKNATAKPVLRIIKNKTGEANKSNSVKIKLVSDLEKFCDQLDLDIEFIRSM